MATENEMQRDRIVRFTNLPDGLLSRLDTERNILEIDKAEAGFLSDIQVGRLTCSDEAATRVVLLSHGGGFGFEPVT